jgi:hypothetical protein
MKILSVLFIAIIVSCTARPAAAQGNPFLALKYDSVVIYDLEFERWRDEMSVIDKNGKLNFPVNKRAKLDNKSVQALSKKLGSKSSYGNSEAACFEPHLGIVYYSAGKPVAQATICISCNRLESSLPIPAQMQGKQTAEDGTIYYNLMGMSKEFRKYLDKLLEKHKFSHRPKPGSMFDE